MNAAPAGTGGAAAPASDEGLLLPEIEVPDLPSASNGQASPEATGAPAAETSPSPQPQTQPEPSPEPSPEPPPAGGAAGLSGGAIELPEAP